jgi:HEPN domain-containing protein
MSSSDPASWLELASRDASAARRLLQPPASLAHAAYFVQQAAEKTIKAPLIDLKIGFPRHGGRGHDLVSLVGLVPVDDPLKVMFSAISVVTPLATAFRYPSDDPTTEETPTLNEVEGRADQVEAIIRTLAAIWARRLAD